MKHNALLEIGTEEIPAKKVSGIHQNIKTKAEKLMKDNRISVKNINIMGSPRRLSVYFEEISESQDDLIEEIKGPPYEIAFDDKGNPTKAATGFAGSQDLTVEDLEIRETENGKYMYAVKERKNQCTEDLLPDIFVQLITSINFPITMRWGNYNLEFIRPIHWICSLFDDQLIEIEIEGIKSGRKSRGHRFLDNRDLEIKSAVSYIEKLKKSFVLVNPEQRKQEILSGIKNIEKETQSLVQTDEDLLEEVIHLVEYPTPFCGEFDDKYLDLPEPVLVTPTKEHQRYFPMRDQDGKLISKFVGVRDGSKEHLKIVKEGNEKVLRARFADAEFYYKKDINLSMETRIEQLKGIVFREELGSMYNKVNRIKKIVSWLGQKLKLKEDKIENAKRAAYLSKADLVSHMVREFPELQGVMGEIYAGREGENAKVSRAISEHYRPKFSQDRLPSSIEAKLISIADNIDTITGCFAIGLKPTGSEDPYGLRRSAIGIIRILEEANIDLSLDEICNYSLGLFDNLTGSVAEVKEEVLVFLLDRLNTILQNRDIPYDVIQASIQGLSPNIPEIIKCSQMIAEIKQEKIFIELVTAYNRVQSIIENQNFKKKSINSRFLLEKQEKTLYNKYLKVHKQILNINKKYNFQEKYEVLKDLIIPIHEFFENVKVMADEKEIKINRLNLLYLIKLDMSLLGDLSEIVIE